MNWAEKFSTKREKPTVVTDLDAIVRDSIAVTLHGKKHVIRPVLVEEFFALANAWAVIGDLDSRKNVGIDEVIDAYFGVIHAVCPTITREDLRTCTLSQITGFLRVVMEHSTGGLTDEKKKALKIKTRTPQPPPL